MGDPVIHTYSYKKYNKNEYRSTYIRDTKAASWHVMADMPWPNSFLQVHGGLEESWRNPFKESIAYTAIDNPIDAMGWTPAQILPEFGRVNSEHTDFIASVSYCYEDQYNTESPREFRFFPIGYDGGYGPDGAYYWWGDSSGGALEWTGFDTGMGTSELTHFKACIGPAAVAAGGGPPWAGYSFDVARATATTNPLRAIGKTYNNVNADLYKDEGMADGGLPYHNNFTHRQWDAAAFCGEYFGPYGVGELEPSKDVVTTDVGGIIFVAYGDLTEVEGLKNSLGTPISSDVHYAYNKYLEEIKRLSETIYLSSTTDRRFSMKQQQARKLSKPDVTIPEGSDTAVTIALKTTKTRDIT